jgi:uncharacterized metal-binding protein
MNTLRNKLTASYVLLALVIVAAVSIVFNIALEKVFIDYTVQKQKKQMEKVTNPLNKNANFRQKRIGCSKNKITL